MDIAWALTSRVRLVHILAMTEIWHNPRCSKSCAALERIEGAGLNANIVLYLKEPPSRERLEEVAAMLGGAHALVRKKEAAYKERGLSAESSEAELLDAMEAEPKLIERPVVITDKGARIGRPTEAIDEVL